MSVTRHEMQDLALASSLLNRAAFGEEDVSVGELLARAVEKAGPRREASISVRAVEAETGASSVMLAAGQPQLSTFQRRLFLRSIIPVLPTTTYSTPFVRELAPMSSEGGASGVPEGGAKPDVGAGLSFTPILNTPGVLAAQFTASEQLLADSAAFVAYTNARLPYELRVAEERAVISGNGEPANADIVGIVHTAGVAAVTGTDLPAGIVNAAAAVAGNGALPDTVVCNAADYWTAYGAAPVFFDGDSLRLTVIPTVGVPAGTAVVGAFATGAVINDRQQVTVEAFNQHADYASNGLVLVLAEERVGFEVLQPWSFAVATGF